MAEDSNKKKPGRAPDPDKKTESGYYKSKYRTRNEWDQKQYKVTVRLPQVWEQPIKDYLEEHGTKLNTLIKELLAERIGLETPEDK